MDTVISVINFIRKNGLTHRQFKKFLGDVEAENVDVMHYREVK
jgi:hypothetical protein